MANTFHVHGACYVMVATGVSNAYENLGLTQEGADIDVEHFIRGIKTDASGEGNADFQQMGGQARITLALAAWDATILAKIVNRAAASATVGQMGQTGAILGQGGFSFGLYLPSTTDDPWVFPTAVLKDPHKLNVGSKYGVKRLTFTAWPLLGPTDLTLNLKNLYSRTAPS